MEQYLKITFTLAPGMRLLCIKSYPLAEGSKLKNDNLAIKRDGLNHCLD